MKIIDQLLSNTVHRPWNIPEGKWSYYQEWNNALFLHWKIPSGDLRKYLDSNLLIDTYKSESWISLVAFSMEKIRPRGLPSIPLISNFHEVNISTYLTHHSKPGVYFLNIEAEKQVSCMIAKTLSGLPYRRAEIYRTKTMGVNTYSSNQKASGFKFEAAFNIGKPILAKTDLDVWLTERYCLYFNKGNNNYRYEIHHKPWDLYEVNVDSLLTDYQFGDISLNKKPDLIHYSQGVNVISWQKRKV